jgi:HSP20 family protein
MLCFTNYSNSLFNDLFSDSFFTQTTKSKTANIEKNEKEFLLTTALPGFSKEEVQVSVENDTLKIIAKSNKKQYWNKQEYNQSYILENNIDTNNIVAKLENGLLTILLPIKEQAKLKTISIE